MRLLGQTLFVAAAIGLSLTLAPACVDNDQSIYVRQIQFPTEDCVFQPDETATALFEGRVDVALTDNYSAVALIGNQMIQRSDNLNARAESSKAHLDGAIVRVTDANGNDLREFTSPASGFANNAASSQASFGLIKITLLDAQTLARFKRTGSSPVRPGEDVILLANFKVFGETLGGVDLESGEYQFPIRVCNGCLIDFTKNDDPKADGLDCNLQNSAAGSGSGGQTEDVTICSFGNDVPVPCTVCLGAFDPDVCAAAVNIK